MRIVRFVGPDRRLHYGADHGDGSATILADPRGVLGAVSPNSRRELLRGKHALVADDDRNMLELMATTLAKAGCECTVCTDGRQAIDAIRRRPLDLVVADIVMPHHSGYEIFSEARAQRADMPVVLVTGFGYDPDHVLVRACREGLSTVLYKPFTPQELLDELERALREALRDPADALVETGDRVAIEATVAPVVPSNIICIGRNYPDAGRAAPPAPGEIEVFMKPSGAVQGPGGAILMPDLEGEDPRLDCEGELAVVIGLGARCVAESEAHRYVLGYTAANDVTARRWQTASGPPWWMRGKGFDTFCPLGPAILSRAEIEDPAGLAVRTLVNGEVVREGSVGDMIRSVPAIICALSRVMTLPPATVILTGAPPRRAGAGEAPPLAPGDEVTVEIEPIGRLRNTITAAGA